jgi:hypothetical protein
MRCFEGRVYDIERGAWVACERCSGTGRVVVYLYPKLKAVHGSATHDPLRAGVSLPGRRFSCDARGGGSQEWEVALLGVHTPSKNPRPVSCVQAYIAYLLGRWILCKLAPSGLGYEPRNACLDA